MVAALLALAVAAIRVLVGHAHRGAAPALVHCALGHSAGISAATGAVDKARAIARKRVRVLRARRTRAAATCPAARHISRGRVVARVVARAPAWGRVRGGPAVALGHIVARYLRARERGQRGRHGRGRDKGLAGRGGSARRVHDADRGGPSGEGIWRVRRNGRLAKAKRVRRRRVGRKLQKLVWVRRGQKGKVGRRKVVVCRVHVVWVFVQSGVRS